MSELYIICEERRRDMHRHFYHFETIDYETNSIRDYAAIDRLGDLREEWYY